METAVQVKNSMVSHKCPSVEQLLLKVLHFMKKYSGMFYLVITAKLQTAFDYFFFDCPCDAKSNCAYSLAFLLCPTIAILLWGGIKCCEKRRTDSWMTKCFIPVGWTLLFIFTWIATAFLNENFYLCIASEGSTSNETAIADPANLPCLAEEENESPQSKRKAQMESCSQIIGVALGSVTFVLGIVLSSFSYMLQKTQRSSKKEGRYKTIFKEEQDRVFDTLPKKRARTEIGRQSMNEFTSFTITLNEQGKGSPDAQDKPGSSGEAENQHLLKVGRPIDEERQLLFEKLCLWIDEGVEHGITTLAEIHRKMEELDPSEDKSLAYSPRYLKIKLQEQYEESLYFTSDERRTDIVCLRDMTNAILRDYRQQVLNPSQTLDDAELKELTISTAINLICGDLARVPLDQKQYPSVESMTNTQKQLALIPNSLQKLLKPIVKSDEKVAVWGQNLLKAYRPRSGVMPSQLGLTIQLDHMFGSKWLIDRCHHLGYSESYAELHRYKYCYLNMKNGLGSIDQDIMVTEKDEAAAVEIEEAKVDAVLSPEQAEEQEENSDEMDEGFAVFVPEESTVHKCVGDNIDLNINQLDDKRSEEDTGEFDE